MNPLRSSSPTLVLLMTLAACGSHAATKTAAVDQSSPKALAESIFAAARSGDFAPLKGIASADADKDAKNVAGVADAPAEQQASFQKHFAPGKVVGDATIEGDQASVPIKFGPDATRDETFAMVKANGVWYLQSF
jgi:hypothetical protein